MTREQERLAGLFRDWQSREREVAAYVSRCECDADYFCAEAIECADEAAGEFFNALDGYIDARVSRQVVAERRPPR